MHEDNQTPETLGTRVMRVGWENDRRNNEVEDFKEVERAKPWSELRPGLLQILAMVGGAKTYGVIDSGSEANLITTREPRDLAYLLYHWKEACSLY